MDTTLEETELHADNLQDSQKPEIPPELADFRERSANTTDYIYIRVYKKDLQEIADEGLLAGKNGHEARDPRVEEIFERVAKEKGRTLTRENCVYAYPRRPSSMSSSLDFHKENEVMLQAEVDPEKCIVTSGELFTDASVHKPNGQPQDDEFVRRIAEEYWDSAMTLKDYKRALGTIDFDDFSFPEILTDYISPKSIRVVEKW